MGNLLGIPQSTLAVVMAIAAALVLAGLLVVGLKYTVLFKMGLRNLMRRRSQTVLLILGLMISTILLTTSLTLGDSVSYSLRTANLSQVGNIDEGVSKLSIAGRVAIPFFSADEAQQVSATIRNNSHVAAFTSVITTPQQSIGVYDTTSQAVSAENFVMGIPADFDQVWGSLKSGDGTVLHTSDLQSNEMYMGKTLAQELGARAGDQVHVVLLKQSYTFTLRAVLNTDLNPAVINSNMVAISLTRFQQIVNLPGSVNAFFIRNQGNGGLSNLGPNNSVSKAITSDLRSHFPQFTVAPFKQDAVKNAISTGSTVATVMGGLSLLIIIAALLLIYLIITLLASERKAELGMSRAVGMKRAHVVQVFMFEGMCYTLCSTLIGLPLGVGITVLIVKFIDSIPLPPVVGQLYLNLYLGWSSILLAFCLGLLLTFMVVVISAYRISRMNIVSAIRALEDGAPQEETLAQLRKKLNKSLLIGQRARAQKKPFAFLYHTIAGPLGFLVQILLALFSRGVLTALVGAVFLSLGLKSHLMWSYTLGVSLTILGVGLMIRWLVQSRGKHSEVADRIGFTVIGLGLLFYGLQIFGPVEKLFGLYDRLNLANFQAGPENALILSLVVIAALIWIAMYNGDLLSKGVMLVANRMRTFAPVARTSMAYPLSFKFRTGLTVTMFALVTFITIIIVTLNSTFAQNNQLDTLTGGWPLMTDSPGLPSDLNTQIMQNPTLAQEVDRVAWHDAQYSRITFTIPGKKVPFTQTTMLRGCDPTFLTQSHIQLQARASGYSSDSQVWDAIRTQPGLAVIYIGQGPLIGTVQPAPAVGITTFEAFDVAIKHAQVADTTHHLKVIGILPETYQWPGVYTSVASAQPIMVNPVITPNWYFIHPKPGVRAEHVAVDLQHAFGAKYGLQLDVESERINMNVTSSSNLAIFLRAYLALGLIVGVCGLGIISSLSVVERRQQIGMLRALGYRRRMVQLSFLLESGFTTVVGLMIGTVLGLWASYHVVDTLYTTNNVHIPFLEITLILLLSCCATLLTTYLPARAASKIRPAEALRYE